MIPSLRWGNSSEIFLIHIRSCSYISPKPHVRRAVRPIPTYVGQLPHASFVIISTDRSFNMMLRRFRPGFARTFATNFKERPGPPPLEREAQLEFERLQKKAMASNAPHPEVRKVYNDFEGDVNPETGEVGGPKQDPLRHGDYSFNGRVTDF